MVISDLVPGSSPTPRMTPHEIIVHTESNKRYKICVVVNEEKQNLEAFTRLIPSYWIYQLFVLQSPQKWWIIQFCVCFACFFMFLDIFPSDIPSPLCAASSRHFVPTVVEHLPYHAVPEVKPPSVWASSKTLWEGLGCFLGAHHISLACAAGFWSSQYSSPKNHGPYLALFDSGLRSRFSLCARHGRNPIYKAWIYAHYSLIHWLGKASEQHTLLPLPPLWEHQRPLQAGLSMQTELSPNFSFFKGTPAKS